MKQTTPLRPFSVAGWELTPAETAKLRARPLPGWIAPELATLTHAFFWDRNWAYEEKLDGERVLARKDMRVTLYSRNRQNLTATYPEIAEALSAVPGRWWLDGEVVALDNRSVSNFKILQQRLQVKNAQAARRSEVAVYYYLFDIMYIDGYDTTALPYRSRRELLDQLIHATSALRLTAAQKPVQQSLTDACQRGWEGLVVKDLSSPYVSKRTRDWLKFKCVNEQELVIIGYTDPKRSRVAFGALLLGYYANNELHYAGKVGTGFDTSTLHMLLAQMRPYETPRRPVPEHVPMPGVHWLRPALIAQVGFTEWTTSNKLRHPRFLGLRTDKTPWDVVKE